MNMFKTNTKLTRLYHDFASSKTYKYMMKANEICEKIVPFYEKPTMLNAVRAGLGVLHVFLEGATFYVEDFFHINDNWEADSINQLLIPLILQQIKHYPYEIIRTPLSKDAVVKIVNFDGIKVGWILDTNRPEICEEIYVQRGKYEQFKQKLKFELWKSFGDANIVLRHKKSNSRNDSKQTVEFVVDDLVGAMPSQQATDIANKFQKAFNVNENRSLLMFGPPGSGKSTMARQIVNTLQLKSFRLCVEDIDSDMTFFYEIINLFQPTAIILDDFDRSMKNGVLLEMIAFVRKHVKLVIGTANDRDAIDDAILRPERFDEVVFIDTLDDAVIKNILGQYVEEAFELVKTWPIVFITEYCRRRKWLTEDEVKESFNELAERVDRLKKYIPKQYDPLIDCDLLKKNPSFTTRAKR